MFWYNELRMCHDALKFVARVFKQTGNKSKMEHGGVLHDKRCELGLYI